MQDNDPTVHIEPVVIEPKHITHALCPSCNEVKPMKDFKTKSTIAQARAWGYKQAIDITTKRCKACRPKKKPHELSLKEIHNRIATGDLKGGVIGEAIKRKRIADGRRRMREGVINRWAQSRREYWHTLYDDTILEYKRTRSSLYAKSKEKLMDTKPELYAFYNYYLSVLSKVRGVLMLNAKHGEPIPKQKKAKKDKGHNSVPTWHSMAEPQQIQDLHRLWGSIPIEHKLRLTLPELLKGEEA